MPPFPAVGAYRELSSRWPIDRRGRKPPCSSGKHPFRLAADRSGGRRWCRRQFTLPAPANDVRCRCNQRTSVRPSSSFSTALLTGSYSEWRPSASAVRCLCSRRQQRMSRKLSGAASSSSSSSPCHRGRATYSNSAGSAVRTNLFISCSLRHGPNCGCLSMSLQGTHPPQGIPPPLPPPIARWGPSASFNDLPLAGHAPSAG